LTQLITAAVGFLVAVLWFDLMFDVQVLPHRRSSQVPDNVLDSISAYYRRVTTTASPMGRLVGLTMLVLLALLVAEAARSAVPVWVSAFSLSAAGLAIGLAIGRVFGAARRLGTRTDPRDVQTRLARGIFRDHVICLAAMVGLMAVQLTSP
jgi:hypothetical protein